jgi:hypothetical protein
VRSSFHLSTANWLNCILVYVFKFHSQASKSRISLVSDVWTTKGSHKAFIGIMCCYIAKDWTYVCQHLAIKYVSWHHNGNYLVAPLARVLVKHGLHNKISLLSLHF